MGGYHIYIDVYMYMHTYMHMMYRFSQAKPQAHIKVFGLYHDPQVQRDLRHGENADDAWMRSVDLRSGSRPKAEVRLSEELWTWHVSGHGPKIFSRGGGN